MEDLTISDRLENKYPKSLQCQSGETANRRWEERERGKCGGGNFIINVIGSQEVLSSIDGSENRGLSILFNFKR